MSAIKLDIKITSDGTSIHLDGDSNDVLTFYDKLCSSGLLRPLEPTGEETEEAINPAFPEDLQEITETIPPSEPEPVDEPAPEPAPQPETPPMEEEPAPAQEPDETPVCLTIQDVLSKNPAFTVTEWLLVNLLFATEYGKNTIDRISLTGIYRETGQFTHPWQKGLTSYLNSFRYRGWVERDKGVFTLLPKGVCVARELLEKVLSSDSALEEEKKSPSFAEFAKEYHLKASTNYALAIVYYLERVLEDPQRTSQRIQEIWEDSGEPLPNDFKAVLRHNRSQASGYIQQDADGNYTLLPRGEERLMKQKIAAPQS